MRIGLYGGNFDPVHLGHLITAQAVLEQRNLDKILFMPAHISPFKTGVKSSSADDRLNMLKLAIGQQERFEISNFEIDKEGVSYTVETLKALKQQYSRIELIIGYDNFVDFDKWKSPDEILTLADVVVLRRIMHDKSELKETRYDKLVSFAETPIIEISSTEIRKRIREGKSIDFLVPPKVKEYINSMNLYKD